MLNPLVPEFILKLSRFIGCHRFWTLGTNGLNAENSAHHLLSSRSFLLCKQASSLYSLEEQWRTRRCSSTWSVYDRGR